MTKSIVSRSLTNVKVALLLFLVNLILSFIVRKYLLEYLGAEILGLNTVSTNLVGFLNLAELGITSAISYALYKPLLEGDREEINHILSVQYWLYRRIAIIIIVSAVVLMCFFPVIFKKSSLPLWYAYGTFSVLLIVSLLSYFISFIQILLIADLKEYKVNLCLQGSKFSKYIVQILAVSYIDSPFIFWLASEFIFGVFTNILIFTLVKREYKWIKVSHQYGKEHRTKYNQIITNIKQVFFHKIGSVVLTQTSPVIIYSYISLSIVTIYENYMIIIMGILALNNAIFSSIQAAVGNLIARGDKQKINQFLGEYTSIRFWIASIICFSFYFQSSSFVSLWIGDNFIIDDNILILLTIYAFLALTRVSDTFLYGYGLFKDIYAPIIEAILNIGLSVLLGYWYGLAGIISGVIISLFLVVFCWKPYFLHKEGLKLSLKPYIVKLVSIGLLIVSSILCSEFVIHFIGYSYQKSIINWVVYSAYITLIYIFVSSIIFIFFNKDFRSFLIRLKNK